MMLVSVLVLLLIYELRLVIVLFGLKLSLTENNV